MSEFMLSIRVSAANSRREWQHRSLLGHAAARGWRG